MWYISAIVFIIFISACCAAYQEQERSLRCFYQPFYKKAAEKFGEDYYYPQSSCRSILQINGTIIREETHYKPVRHSTFDCFTDKKELWFIEVLRVDDGRNQFIDRIWC